MSISFCVRFTEYFIVGFGAVLARVRVTAAYKKFFALFRWQCVNFFNSRLPQPCFGKR